MNCMKILIAEDDPISRRLVEANLIDWGHEPIITADGAEALIELEKANAPLIAILDVMMPRLDGFELCRRVRAIETETPPYLIMLTAKQGKEDIVAGIEAGANDYLSKPFHRSELQVRLNVGIKTVELQRSLAARVRELSDALGQVKQLQGFFAICSYCKDIRTNENQWEQIETYVSQHSEAKFSHGICPTCYEHNVKPMLKTLKS